MKSHPVLAGDTPVAPQPGGDRAARLLSGMHKVFSHDLPNQMVVLQSLLQLLQMEELDRLSADGREYVERLSSAARKAGLMVRFLKDMSRLHAYQPQVQELTLAALARELRAELNQLCPGQTIDYSWQWDSASVRADHRSFYQALLGLLQERIETAEASCHIQGGSGAVAAGIRLDFSVTPAGAAGAEPRLETVLARELLAVGGAVLTLDPADHGHFSILVPG